LAQAAAKDEVESLANIDHLTGSLVGQFADIHRRFPLFQVSAK
jgi:hypothetical protein